MNKIDLNTIKLPLYVILTDENDFAPIGFVKTINKIHISEEGVDLHADDGDYITMEKEPIYEIFNDQASEEHKKRLSKFKFMGDLVNEHGLDLYDPQDAAWAEMEWDKWDKHISTREAKAQDVIDDDPEDIMP